jgi:hypothetical protein
MCHGGSRVGTVSLSSSNAHSDCQEDNGRGMVAGSGPLAFRKGSRSRMEGSSTRTATTKIAGLDMDVGCYEDSKVIKGGVYEPEPRLKPLRTSRELALGNLGIGQGVRHSSNDDPYHSLDIGEGSSKFPGP